MKTGTCPEKTRNREQEIIDQLPAFGSERIESSALIAEMLELQKEIANVAFHVTDSDARIWEVCNYLSQLNEEHGHVADAELARFTQDSRVFANDIKALISGKRGEDFTARRLETLRTPHIVLRNVELENHGTHTELDFVIVTRKALFILEVKNTKKDIFIDENGDYFTTGKRERLDCNIREKMKFREEILSDVLRNAGIFTGNIVSLLVFTNNRMELHNECRDLDVTFLNRLPFKIDRYAGWNVYTEDQLDDIKNAVEAASVTGTYKCDTDIQTLKTDFARLMVALEKPKKQGPKEIVSVAVAAAVAVVCNTVFGFLAKKKIQKSAKRRIRNAYPVSAGNLHCSFHCVPETDVVGY